MEASLSSCTLEILHFLMSNLTIQYIAERNYGKGESMHPYDTPELLVEPEIPSWTHKNR